MRAISEFKNAGLFGRKLIGSLVVNPGLVVNAGLPNTGCVPLGSERKNIGLFGQKIYCCASLQGPSVDRFFEVHQKLAKLVFKRPVQFSNHPNFDNIGPHITTP